MNLAELDTESRNPRSERLDTMSTAEVLALMNDEDRLVSDAIALVLDQVAQAVELVAASLHAGGRLIYLGAGTSGRLGLLDAVECPPTFSTDPGQVVAMLAGGDMAFVRAVEGAEDDPEAAARQVDAHRIGARDTVVGIAASGRTPYVVGGLRRAHQLGASTVALACNAAALISQEADVAIEVLTGPEVLTGSTRLKAGTAQKMVCNMISTAAMVRIGKTYGNLMVDLRPTNAKLVDRARRIVAAAADVDEATAARALTTADGRAKVAIVMLLAAADAPTAARLLDNAAGVVSNAVAH
ncbi:N-acetylmuramic acid 6-phosphate etherase [Leekyejoonella antrihumi]|uniref:N-acetylmuramic acid 6-phosphate etherase n=1 Tax=Leekyejoonella antrihumi TaxID=1660198 RepID=A0A563E1F1_9MICO|nr:N-acetylmuramic acid 6-phosphate etherase [Leekyejoonella antrihumi]TWP36358.1 N-acetylmuramic acid 6-phosphate etherase [Leekyejoonella antrihumi]